MPASSKKGVKGFIKKPGRLRPDTTYIFKRCVIGVDQSYQRTGISIAVDGKLKIVSSVDFKNVKSKTAKRILLKEKLDIALNSCLRHFDSSEISVVCERIRTFTSEKESKAGINKSVMLLPQVIKSGATLIAVIVDAAFLYGIETWSVETRSWKKGVLGTSMPVFEPIEGVKDPQKFGSVRKIIELGFEESIRRCKGNGVFVAYDDDAADSACIALYGFCDKPLLVREQ